MLTGLDQIGVSIEYSGPEGATFEEFPYHQSMVHKARAEFEMLPGWDEDISGARSLDDLPAAARSYVDYIADFLGIPIILAGVGPARDQVIWTADAPARFAAAAAAGA